MAWVEPIDVETGEYMDGDVWESGRAAIVQLQGALGADETTAFGAGAFGRACQHIETITPSGDPASFLNIPQDFTHLKIVGASRHGNQSGNGGHVLLSINFNDDLSANSYRFLVRWDDPTGGGRAANDTSNVGAFGLIGPAGWQPFEVTIPWYALVSSSHQYKGESWSALASTGGAVGFRICQGGGFWIAPESAPITSIQLRAQGADNLDGGRVSLYGLP